MVDLRGSILAFSKGVQPMEANPVSIFREKDRVQFGDLATLSSAWKI